MYVATVADDRVVAIDSNVGASLDTMAAVANLRFGRPKSIIRFEVPESVWIDYANGKHLDVDYVESNGKLVPVVVA